MTRTLLALAILACAVPAMLRAQPVAMQELVAPGHAAGQGRLRFWGLDVYDASLRVATGFRQDSFADHGFALRLHYLRSFSGADIARRSLEEMRRVGGVSAAQAPAWQAALARLPDVAAGDHITGVNRPGRAPLFFHNGRPLGEIGDAQFARPFFGIWLAPQTSEPGLRAALLAGAER